MQDRVTLEGQNAALQPPAVTPEFWREVDLWTHVCL